MDITLIAIAANDWSRRWGFYDVPRNRSEQLFLIVTELSEAIDAHRGTKIANRPAYEQYGGMEIGPALFEFYIKSTLQDEFADAAIRILEYVAEYHNLELFEHYVGIATATVSKRAVGNLADECLQITREIVKAEPTEYSSGAQQLDRLSNAFAMIQNICDRNGYDLDWHIREKMKYNETRPRKNGKSY